jgi:multidrug efflux pump subunit AcrA (membrane-fusion protein)
MRCARIIFILPALLASAAAHAQTVTVGDELEQLKKQIAAERVELAQARLELSKIIADLGDMRRFLNTDPEGDILRWRQQRADLAAQRQALADERKSIESSKLNVVEAAKQRAAAAQQQAAEAARSAPRWQFEYKIAVIPTGQLHELVYIDPITGAALVQRYPDIDRKNIMLRGTIQNRSEQPWRYTFDVRVANQPGRIIGKWRYQTPVLGPNELHTFEVKIPVTDVAEIDRYQIGNIEADRGHAITGTAPVVNTPAPPPPTNPVDPTKPLTPGPDPYFPKTPR